ncbi:hypothetical protein KAR91_46360 [Candidatus Pacearchaeota archaeon]|nr:hypothetical protein [Candidatus Pacearchaeota archaeon]
MTINLSSKTGGSAVLLAPDLTYPSDLTSPTDPVITVSGIDAQGSLTTVLNLTGKFSIPLLGFTVLTAETITVKLTVDSVVIWNDTFTSGTALNLLGDLADYREPIQCNSTFLLELQTATDTSVDLNYMARAIL